MDDANWSKAFLAITSPLVMLSGARKIRASFWATCLAQFNSRDFCIHQDVPQSTKFKGVVRSLGIAMVETQRASIDLVQVKIILVLDPVSPPFTTCVRTC